MDHRKIAQLLVFGALIAVILAPPEAFGSGRMILILASSFAFLILVLKGEVPAGFLIAGFAGAAFLSWHSVWMSVDFYRSVEFLGLAWAYYCLFGSIVYSPYDSRLQTSAVLVVLAAGVSAFAIYQFFWGMEQMYSYVFYSGTSDAVRVPMLERIASARVYSTFALPGTLWGFLLLTLPLHAALWRPGRPITNLALVGSVGMLLVATVFTRSYGAALGLLVLALGWMFMRSGSRRWRQAIVAIVLTGLLGGGIYLARPGNYNPFSLRLQNWLSGWEIFASHPLGSGLNTYAVLYLQHQQPGANETQFAHNTPVQLLAELGIFSLVAAIALGLYITRHRKTLFGTWGRRPHLVLALLVWIVHNLVDIDVYFASIGTVGVAVLALLVWTPKAPGRSSAFSAPGMRGGLAWALGVIILVVIVSSALIYISGELLYRAQSEIAELKTEEAAATLEGALRVNPWNSSILHEAGQVALELYQKGRNPADLERAREHFSRAVRLSPNKVGPHVGLGLSLASAGQLDEALIEIETAQALHPYNRQATAIRRLIEARLAEQSN